MEAKVPPTFQLSGDAVFDWCEVFDIPSNLTENEKPASIWRLEPQGTPPELKDVAQITYGQIPTGLVQAIPKDGQPPALVEGHRYRVLVVIRAPASIGLKNEFIVRNGKVEIVEGEDKYRGNCFAD